MDHESRVARSKALGKEENYKGGVPHRDAPPPKLEHGASAARRNLRGDLDAQQLNTFTRWWNSWLIEANVKVVDLCEEIRPGVISIKLLEVLSDSSCGKVRAKWEQGFPRCYRLHWRMQLRRNPCCC